MKYIYESEVLYRLMERDGFNIPSSVPPYESEIKAYLINQVKLAYPKLTDYEAEWLLYNYTKHIPADFPIKSFINVTEATVNNVVPYAYKSAILKGQTLVNMLKFKETFTALYNIGSYVYSDNKITIVGNGVGDGFAKSDITVNLESNKTYTFKGNCDKGFNDDNGFIYLLLNNSSSKATRVNTGNTTFQVSESGVYYVRLDIRDSSQTYVFSDLMILEGDYTNQDIPYFEGMQSVKMPVLTIVGKNLFKASDSGQANGLTFTASSNNYLVNGTCTKDNTDFYLMSSATNVDIYQKLNSLPVGTKISVSKNNSVGRQIYLSISQKDGTPTKYVQTYTTTENDKAIWCFVRFMNGNTFDNVEMNVQVEINSSPTSYEPYKSNILTVNEEVELRGIGDVKDTLDCLTGEVVERIGEVVLNGSENWAVNNTQETTTNRFILNEVIKSDMTDATLSWYMVDKLPKTKWSNSCPLGITLSNGKIFLYNNSIEYNISALKSWLSQNPITVQYQLKTPTIKTVDLSVVNQDGEECYFMPIEGTMYMTTDGQPIKPLLYVEVPVEATGQNLASFINMKMNDKEE